MRARTLDLSYQSPAVAEARFRAWLQQIIDDRVRQFRTDVLTAPELSDIARESALEFVAGMAPPDIEAAVEHFRRMVDRASGQKITCT